MRRTILFYGNCQTQALSEIFAAQPAIRSEFDIAYIASYAAPQFHKLRTEPAAIESVIVLFEQINPDDFPQRELLPADCTTITFPSLDLNLLWPLTCGNPYIWKRTDVFPFGYFSTGDSVIVECVKRGMSVEEILAFYRSSAAEYFPNFDRLLRLERARLAHRDAKCTIRMAEYTITRFPEIALFVDHNHPTTFALRELCYRLLESVFPISEVFRDISLGDEIVQLPAVRNTQLINIPIHPIVARHFDLSWYPDPDTKAYLVGGEPATYDDYFRAFAEDAVRARDGALLEIV